MNEQKVAPMEAARVWITPQLVLIGPGSAARGGTQLGHTDGVTKDGDQFFSP
jgi:hypothetical protein